MAAPPGRSSSVPSLPPPCPKSPPAYPDLYGKRREVAKVQMLEREIGFLQEELKSAERIQLSSRCCKEVTDFVVANPDPLMPTNRKKHRSCRFWKWLRKIPCFNFSWICCCCYSKCCSIQLEMPQCCCDCKCSPCDCFNPCAYFNPCACFKPRACFNPRACCNPCACCGPCDCCCNCPSCFSCALPKWCCCCSCPRSNCCKKMSCSRTCCCILPTCSCLGSCPDCSSCICKCKCKCSCPSCCI